MTSFPKDRRRDSLRMVRNVTLVATGLLVTSLTAQAQTRTLFGNTGSTGGSTRSSSQGLGRSLFGGSGQGTGTGTGAGSQTTGSLFGGQTSAMAGFGRTTAAGDAGGFVGGFQAGEITPNQNRNLPNQNRSLFNRNAASAINARNLRSAGQGFQLQQGGNNNATPRSRSFQPGFRIGFDVPPAAPGVLITRLGPRMTQSRAFRQAAITVRQEGPVVVLEGRVATQHERLLAETIARLEPGVSRVRNDLVLDPPVPD